MKSLTGQGPIMLLLAESVLLDEALRCGVDVSRDLRYVQRRYAGEGLPFLTITLPMLSDWLERSLAEGYVTDEVELLSFTKGRSGFPVFLTGFFKLIFDESGVILDDPCPNAILSVRQISRAFKKLEIPLRKELDDAAIDKFRQTDLEVGWHKSAYDWQEALRGICAALYSTLLARVEETVLERTINPHHGSGSVVEPLNGPDKFRADWRDEYDLFFPRDHYWTLGNVDPSERDGPSSVRVTTVPKTQKGPRIIAIEPACCMFLQQGVKDVLYREIEYSFLEGYIGFTDQTRNQHLAKEGSITGHLVTFDLSEASDRVSLESAKAVFGLRPDLWDAIVSIRSESARLPDGETIQLRKFASMGSAMCFPTEAMFFFALTVLADLIHEYRLGTTRYCSFGNAFQFAKKKYRKQKRGGISVYGDDIIVPEKLSSILPELFEEFGLKINRSKSFTSGKFRESCGGDYFNGVDVKPTYVRQLPPSDMRDAKSISSWIELGNNFLASGNWISADFCRRVVEDLTGPLPVGKDLPFLHHEGYYSSWRGVKTRWNSDHQHLEARGYSNVTQKHPFTLEGLRAVAWALTDRPTEFLPGILDVSPNRGVRFDVRYSTNIRRKWVSLA